MFRQDTFKRIHRAEAITPVNGIACVFEGTDPMNKELGRL